MDIKSIKEDFWVRCNVCSQPLKNWIGSTPCCGSIAYLIKEGGATSTDFVLYGKITQKENDTKHNKR